MQQINVILPVAGADYVGPLPAEVQGYVDFAVGVLAVSKQPDAAQALVKFMSSPDAAPPPPSFARAAWSRRADRDLSGSMAKRPGLLPHGGSTGDDHGCWLVHWGQPASRFHQGRRSLWSVSCRVTA
jgi:hypothetical protein